MLKPFAIPKPVHEDVRAAIEAVIPPRRVPWRKRLFWAVVLRVLPLSASGAPVGPHLYLAWAGGVARLPGRSMNHTPHDSSAAVRCNIQV